MATAPCKNCAERHPACWDRCEKYLAFKKEKEECNKEMRALNTVCRANKVDRQKTRKLGG